MILNRDFFEGKDSLTLAKDLLGKVLVHKTSEGTLKGIITETEAYSQDEESCHAYGGKKTNRTKVMFEKPGHLYVYFTYGMHYCCNIVSEEEGKGCAVLLRSIEPLEGVNQMIQNRDYSKQNLKELSNGPAKLCQAMNIDKQLNNIDLINNSQIYIEDLDFQPEEIYNTTRIGISKAKDLNWRYYAKIKQN